MSDSGFSQVPPGGRIFDPLSVQPRTGQSLKVEDVRGELRDVRRAVRITGEIVRISRDRETATIRTDRGSEIDVQVRGRVIVSEGQQVEVDIPPGSPPRQITVRPAHAEAQPAPAPQPPELPANPLPGRPPQTAPAPADSAELAAILDKLYTSQARLESVALPPAPLPPGAIVRLQYIAEMPSRESFFPPAPQTLSELTRITAPAPVPAPPGQTAAAQFLLQTPVSHQKQGSAVVFTLDPIMPGTPFLNAGSETGIKAPLLQLMPDVLTAADKKNPAGNILQQIVTRPVLLPQAAATAAISPQSLILADPSAKSRPATPAFPGYLDVRVLGIDQGQAVHHVSPDGEISRPFSLSQNHPVLQTSPAVPTLHAEVAGATPQNQTLVLLSWPGSTESMSFMLQYPATNLPPGTQIEVMPQIHPAGLQMVTPGIMPALTPAADLLSGWAWPAMDDAFRLIDQTLPQAVAAQSLARIIPNPGNPAQMGPAILFFMAAARAGDISGWLGEKAINTLRREGAKGQDILSRLSRDLGGVSKMMSEPVSQEWRAMAIPMYAQGEIHKLHVYYRHQGGEKEQDQKKKENSTRFIFDLDLDRMGPVQLDGLMREKRFDLILRTPSPFSGAMRHTMRQKYLDVLDAGGLTGDLSFQTRADQWVKVDIRKSELKTSA